MLPLLPLSFELTAAEAREQEQLLGSMVNKVSNAIRHEHLRHLNIDVESHHQIIQNLSAEMESMFTSGAYFIYRIAEIVQEQYQVSHDDFVTNGFEEACLGGRPGLQFVFRDIGGDALYQGLWQEAVEYSLCTLFVISLADYAKKEGASRSPGGKSRMKFEAARESLWQQLNNKSNPKIIVIFNKQDVFRHNLKSIRLNCNPDFSSVPPPDSRAPHSWYCSRCENEIVKYFNTEPREFLEKKGIAKQPKSNDENEIYSHFITAAVDKNKCMEVVDVVVKLVKEDRKATDRSLISRSIFK